MSRLASTIALIVVLGLAGCRAPSASPKVVGKYTATNAESLVFLPDTRVLHVRLVAGLEQQVMIGYASPVGGTPNTLSVIAPDTSPFVGTRFEIDTNFTKVTVHWNDLRRTNDVRQNYFERKRDR